MSNQAKKTAQTSQPPTPKDKVICLRSSDLTDPYYAYQDEYSYLERLSVTLAKESTIPLRARSG